MRTLPRSCLPPAECRDGLVAVSSGAVPLATGNESGLSILPAVARASPSSATIREHNLQAKDVIASDTVFQAARPARVGGNVASEAGVGTAGRVGRIVEALSFNRGLELCRHHTGLDHADKVSPVNLLDAVHSL